jgi:threonine dehydratase
VLLGITNEQIQAVARVLMAIGYGGIACGVAWFLLKKWLNRKQ